MGMEVEIEFEMEMVAQKRVGSIIETHVVFIIVGIRTHDKFNPIL